MKNIRKIFILLIVFISAFMVNVSYIKADMSAPEIREFEVVVTDENGIDYYKYDGSVAGHLNKGDKVLVIYEYDGKYTLGVKEKTSYGFETNKTLGDVSSLDGLKIVQDIVDPKEITDDSVIKYDEEQYARVNVDKVDVYSGPSDAYEKVGTINKGLEFKYKYAIGSYGNITYVYIDSNNVTGWVDILKEKVLIQNNTQYIFKNDVSTKCGTIPKNTITTPLYKTDSWSHKALFKYNDCEVLYNAFRDENVLDIYEYINKVNTDITIYKDLDSLEVIGTVPAGNNITVLAGGDFMAGTENTRYIKYNDIIGWTNANDEVFEYVSEVDEKIEIEDTIKVEEPKEINQSNNEEKKPTVLVNTLIIACFAAAAILVITGLVIAILINKKKEK